MRAVYLDAFAGISGNMLLGAFLQLGVPEAHLRNELNKLPVAEEFNLHITELNKRGIQAVYVDVELTHSHAFPAVNRLPHYTAEDGEPKPQETHEHKHDHEHHTHRTFAEIKTMLDKSALSGSIKEMSLSVFQTLAVAEGKVHGVAPEEVHFHEVGAVDSIVDIVGAAICLDYLGVEKIFVSKINTGTGTVNCAHGLMPVPAPATAELLMGFATYHRETQKELTTPTGAAFVKALASYAAEFPAEFTAEQIAYGAGSHDLDFPNVLRMYLGEYEVKDEKPQSKNLSVLETNIDDMNPQIYGYLYDKLLAAGALDVWTTPIFMKKNRPAHKLSVLTDNEHQAACAEIILSESTAIGMRIMPVAGRFEAVRQPAKVTTKYGDVICKVSAYQGHIVSVSPEYDDCVRLAKAVGVPLKAVQQEAMQVMHERLGG